MDQLSAETTADAGETPVSVEQGIPLKPDMPLEQALTALRALGNEARVKVFRLLARCEPVGMTAGELTERMQMRHNTMSNHLAMLTRAGLTCATRRGRFIQYRACMQGMQSLLGFLTNDCCHGNPARCALPDLPCNDDCEAPRPN
jgi:ArsR family transcriptional regulator, arsenate/arsenite/antimonite-responsive transcriptional repressor